jgi:hypothetical protein
MTAPAVLTARLRTNGHCPPSLLAAEGTDLNDIFLQKVSNLVQDGMFCSKVELSIFNRTCAVVCTMNSLFHSTPTRTTILSHSLSSINR